MSPHVTCTTEAFQEPKGLHCLSCTVVQTDSNLAACILRLIAFAWTNLDLMSSGTPDGMGAWPGGWTVATNDLQTSHFLEGQLLVTAM